ncbi:MAG: sporulation protein YqfD [Clostridia bacterium]|nr:sporulation protein YqfD [Clostridia bacterium]
MLFKIFLFFIIGYVNVEVEGFFIERFINRCVSSKIFIWGLKRKSDTRLMCNMGISDFKSVRKIAKETRCKIKISYKKGLPFLINRYKKRKIFGIFLLTIVLCIIVMSKFVWNIEVKGLEKISDESIISTLKECGLNTGVLKNSVDIDKVIERVRLERDDIAWIGINIDGTNAIVEVVEASPKPEILDKNEYCNIVSDKTGIITKINVTNGMANVSVGDIVEPGTILANRLDGRLIYWC